MKKTAYLWESLPNFFIVLTVLQLKELLILVRGQKEGKNRKYFGVVVKKNLMSIFRSHALKT